MTPALRAGRSGLRPALALGLLLLPLSSPPAAFSLALPLAQELNPPLEKWRQWPSNFPAGDV